MTEKTSREPEPALHPGFSDAEATATPWPDARRQLETAGVFWLTSVRPEGRPHVTPLIGVWLDGAVYFCTGAEERKARNLAANPHCTVVTGANALDEGLDVVVEGDAAQVRDPGLLGRVADAYIGKYGRTVTSPEGTFHGLPEAVRNGEGPLVFEVVPRVAFAFAKGKPFGQTRYRFAAGGPGGA
ncbi:pyridoxamine 5'-phosphate oxidase family protein [Streptomyces sp. NPDC004134]|uniref:pyridoxamine 5'-phosphate oxidase family protein n=1 Tax=Streptomyces sp. NPDC004134 TaxID=3364691 RepID=UPI00367892F7